MFYSNSSSSIPTKIGDGVNKITVNGKVFKTNGKSVDIRKGKIKVAGKRVGVYGGRVRAKRISLLWRLLRKLGGE